MNSPDNVQSGNEKPAVPETQEPQVDTSIDESIEVDGDNEVHQQPPAPTVQANQEVDEDDLVHRIKSVKSPDDLQERDPDDLVHER